MGPKTRVLIVDDEQDILQLVMERRGKVFTRDQSLDAVWKGDADILRAVIRKLKGEALYNPQMKR